MATRTIIEELVTLFGFQTDKQGARDALRTYTDLHHAARDLVSVAMKAADLLLVPIKRVAQLGEHAVNTGRRIGATAEEVQHLDIASRVTGVSAHTLTMVIEKLGVSSFKAATRHKEHVMAFMRLGVSFRDGEGRLKSNTQLFYETAEALSKIENPGKRAQLAYQLMGESSGRLLPLLAMGPGYLAAIREEAEDAGAVISNDAAQSAKELSFWFKILELRTEGVTNRIGVGLLPIASKIVGRLMDWWKANKELVNQKIDVWVGKLASGAEVAARFFIGLWRAAEALMRPLGGFNSVLAAVVLLLGGGLLAAFGAATFAALKFGAALILANAIPILMAIGFGALIGLLLLVVEDLTHVNSLLKYLWDNTEIKPEDGTVVKFLKIVLQTLKAIKGIGDEIFSSKSWTTFFFDVADKIEEMEQKERALRKSDERLLRRAWDWLITPIGEETPFETEQRRIREGPQGAPTFDIGQLQAPDFQALSSTVSSTTSGGGPVTVEINQTFSGDVSPVAVQAATLAGIQQAGREIGGGWERISEAARSGHR